MIPDRVPEGRIICLPRRGEVFARVGDGPELPVVLIHGWMATADVNWFALYRELRDRRAYIAVDLRGHGRSMLPTDRMTLADAADDIAALLGELGHDRALVAGYSMGGAVAQQLTARHAPLVAGLLLSGTALRWNSPFQAVLLRRGGWDGTMQRVTTGRSLGRRLARRAAKTSPLAELVGDWIVSELETGPSRQPSRCGSIARPTRRADDASAPPRRAVDGRAHLRRPPGASPTSARRRPRHAGSARRALGRTRRRRARPNGRARQVRVNSSSMRARTSAMWAAYFGKPPL